MVILFIAIFLVVYTQNNENSENAYMENQKSFFEVGETELKTIFKNLKNINNFRTEFRIQTVLESSSLKQKSMANDDFSKTNNQYVNVDEADFVKTNGEYIVISKGPELKIMSIETNKIIHSITKTKNSIISGIFMNKNKVIILYTETKTTKKVTSNFEIIRNYDTNTKIEIYKLENNKLEILKNFSISGSYTDARLINDNLIVHSIDSIHNKRYPIFYSDNIKTNFDRIMMSPNFKNLQNFNNFLILNTETFDKKTESYVLDTYSNIYFTENSILIVSSKNYKTVEREILKKYIQAELITQKLIPNKEYTDKEYIEELQKILNNETNNLNSMYDLKNLIKDKNIKNELRNKYAKNNLLKISIKNSEFKKIGTFEFNGTLLNQFSIDENSKNEIRIATTKNLYVDGTQILTNNVYIYNKELELIGSLENLAKGEKIYSTRFMGDKLYMVTFKQVDPLFIIDLSNSKNPKVIGKLKIPGFSEYLQMWDTNILIGIGKSTRIAWKNRVITNGVKLSLFDISDSNKLNELDNYIFEGRYTNSISSYEHKSVLINKEKNLIVFPVNNQLKNGYLEKNAAQIFKINKNNTLNYLGQITHESKKLSKKYNYYNNNDIKRILFIKDNLYTISNSKIMVSNLKTLKKIEVVNLNFTEVFSYKNLW
jgi:uncharacterized secreted protein with C-terminal beta-propeller domain